MDEQPHQWTPGLLSELLAKLIRIAFEKNWKWGYFEEFGRALETENFGKWKKRLRTKKNNTKNTRAKKGK